MFAIEGVQLLKSRGYSPVSLSWELCHHEERAHMGSGPERLPDEQQVPFREVALTLTFLQCSTEPRLALRGDSDKGFNHGVFS